MGALNGCRLGFEESLDEYYARFQQEAARVHKAIGVEWLKHFVQQTPEYEAATETNKKLMLKHAWEKYQAVLYFKNSCRYRHGDIIN